MALGLWCQLGFWFLKAVVRFPVERDGPLQGLLTVLEPPWAPLPSTRPHLLFGNLSFFSGAALALASAAKDLDAGLLVFHVGRVCRGHAEGLGSFLSFLKIFYLFVHERQRERERERGRDSGRGRSRLFAEAG